MPPSRLKSVLNEAVKRYNTPSFIVSDPICIPHQFTRLQDIEITAFWAAMLAWGQRKTIINKMQQLVGFMGGEPYEFILHHKEADREPFLAFKHRTFQPVDALYFLSFLQWYYRRYESLEDAFARHLSLNSLHVGEALAGFHELFFSLPDAPGRTRKHVATPRRQSACKRLNMFLRWMVRRDEKGVDFGIWKGISPRQLLIPLDVHVGRTARRLGLLERSQNDWKAVMELTARLREFDAADPARYDYALFGLSILQDDDLLPPSR